MVSGGYSTVQRISPIKLNASHPTASGPTIGEIVLWEFPLSLSLLHPLRGLLRLPACGPGPGWPKRTETRYGDGERKERTVSSPVERIALRFAAPLAKGLRGVVNARPVFTAQVVSVNGG